MHKIPDHVVKEAFTYAAYRDLISGLLRENKTTGPHQSEAMLQYTHMNLLRMDRLDRTVRLLPEVVGQLHGASFPSVWLVLTEAWCGDAAQSLPVMHAMTAVNPFHEIRLILRDEHPGIMDAFLTDGGRSIPIVLFLDGETMEVQGSWGPRPKDLQAHVQKSRKEILAIGDPQEKKLAYQGLQTFAQKWYVRDKTVSIQLELLEAFLAARSKPVALSA